MLSTERLQEIQLIRESIRAVAPRDDLKRIRDLRFKSPGFDRSVWSQMCELGWAGLRVPQNRGGAGLGVVEFCMVAQELGAGLVPEPFIAAGAARLLNDDLLAEALAGALIVLPATQEGPGATSPGTRTAFVGGKVNGTKRFVANARGADAFIVTTAAGPVFVRCNAPGVTIDAAISQDGTSSDTIGFDDAPGEVLSGDYADIHEELTLAHAFYLFGAMEQAFEATLDYVKNRRQFGQAIGSFQSVRHRFADLKVQLEVTRATLDQSALILDSNPNPPQAQFAVSRAKARAADAAMMIANYSVQFHGGMGYTDETDIGLFVRKILSAYNQFGSAKAHRRRFAALGGLSTRSSAGADKLYTAGVDPENLPSDLNELTDDDFRFVVRKWIEENYPEHLPRFPTFRPHRPETEEWYQRLAKRGWLAPGWPREFGGMELSAAKRLIMIEELDRFGCARFSDQGVIMVGPLLMNFGTETQRQRFLPKILTGEHIWSQCYSEPGAGSDLAGLRTEAVLDGEEWVINGQKTWTTLANDANWFYVLVRTDKQAKKQEGISVLLVPADAPGVTVRPFKTLSMHKEFCEIFFDNVRVPKDALVGEVNQGWGIAKALLSFERIFLGSLAQSSKAFSRLADLAAALGVADDPSFQDEVARLACDIADHAALYEIYLEKVRRREELGPDVSMLKINQTELYKRITQMLVDIAGEHAAVVDETPEFGFSPSAVWVQSLPATIYGGASEVQRDIVSKQLLRM
jgi:3-oxochol-4-en-24-oyl-CoA dehydrogenase